MISRQKKLQESVFEFNVVGSASSEIYGLFLLGDPESRLKDRAKLSAKAVTEVKAASEACRGRALSWAIEMLC